MRLSDLNVPHIHSNTAAKPSELSTYTSFLDLYAHNAVCVGSSVGFDVLTSV